MRVCRSCHCYVDGLGEVHVATVVVSRAVSAPIAVMPQTVALLGVTSPSDTLAVAVGRLGCGCERRRKWG